MRGRDILESSKSSLDSVFTNQRDIDSKEQNKEDNNGESHDSKPEEVLSLISSGINPGNIPEVVASNGHDSSSNGGEQAVVGEGEELVTVELTNKAAACCVQAVERISSSGLASFPLVDLVSRGTGGRGNIFSGAAKALNVIFMNIGQVSVAICSIAVVFIDLSGVTVAISGEIDQEDKNNQQDKGEDEESNSPALMINQESNEGDDSDDNAQNEESSDIPEREVGFDTSEIGIVETDARVEDETKAKDQEESASQEDQI